VGTIVTDTSGKLVHSGPPPRRGRTYYGLTRPGEIMITSYKRKKEKIYKRSNKPEQIQTKINIIKIS